MIPNDVETIELLATDIIRDVCELPDRTSPDDWPEVCMVTPEELRIIVTERLQAALEASPNSRTEAVTDEMIEAGVAAFNHTETLSVRRLLEVAYPAMRAAELQAARPIDQQDE